jgi:hypothetical protein
MKLTILNSASLVLALLGSASATDSAVNLRGAVSAAIEYNPDKETAAEKRQANRDARRSRTNKNRSQAEEDAEAARKDRQAANRGAEDPNNSWNNSRRNARNRIRCEMYGENCNYSADTFDDGYGDDYYGDDYYGDDYYYDTTSSGDEFQKFGKTMSALKKAGVEADVVVSLQLSFASFNALSRYRTVTLFSLHPTFCRLTAVTIPTKTPLPKSAQ